MKSLPEIKVGPFKKISYYQADVTGPEEYINEIAEIGRKIASRDDLFNIGINYVLTNAISDKFELTSVNKKKKKK